MTNFVSVDRLRIEVDALLREYPELLDDDIARLDTLEGATDIREVLIRLARALDDTKALQEGVHARIEELTAREGRFVSRGELLRDLIFKVLESANLKKIELPEVTLSLRAGLLRVIGDGDLPDDLVKITRAPDRKKIREAIETGRVVPGFSLSNAPPSLTVRVK